MNNTEKRRGPKVKVLTSQEKSYMVKLGQKLRYWRRYRGFSSHETFAAYAGLPRAQYLRYEHGKNAQLILLLRVLDKLNLTPGQFFNSVEEKNENNNNQ